MSFSCQQHYIGEFSLHNEQVNYRLFRFVRFKLFAMVAVGKWHNASCDNVYICN